MVVVVEGEEVVAVVLVVEIVERGEVEVVFVFIKLFSHFPLRLFLSVFPLFFIPFLVFVLFLSSSVLVSVFPPYLPFLSSSLSPLLSFILPSFSHFLI